MNIPTYTNLMEEEKRKIFYKKIQRIVFENFNYCNRTCSFCVNSIIDRRSNKIIMNDFDFNNLIEELSNNNYSNTIAIGRYSEPLSMLLTFERLMVIKKRLSEAKIIINTNGDYLNIDMIRELDNYGVNELKIMVYLPEKVMFNKFNAEWFSLSKLYEIGLPFNLTNESDSILYFNIRHTGQMKISLRCENYSNPNHGCDRGGSLPRLSSSKRLQPCFAPYFEINIDYNGNVLPCCNIVSDYLPHKDFILGNISNNTLYEIYFNELSCWFRETLKDPVTFQSPCINCSYKFPK